MEFTIDKALSYFNCFEEIRYPTPLNNPKQITGLLTFNDDMKDVFRSISELLRDKTHGYIRRQYVKKEEELIRKSIKWQYD